MENVSRIEMNPEFSYYYRKRTKIMVIIIKAIIQSEGGKGKYIKNI